MECSVQDKKKWGQCRGKQMHFKKYFKCGCDSAYCEYHVSPFLKADKGEPQKCAEHAKKAA